MTLKLYDKLKNKKIEITPADSSSHTKAIQSDNILSLSFTSYECVAFEVNDYIDFCNERFWVTARYVPKQKSTVEWEYSVKLYGIESLIKQFLVLNLVNGAYETEFSLTATAYDHVVLIVNCINYGMGTTDWKVGEVVNSEYLTIDYAGTYCDEGLKTTADKCKVEYWIEGTTVNVSRCEHGEYITLGYDNGLTNLYSDTASNVKFFTRLFPVGSSRNIVYDDYGSSRLQLPNGVKYLDKDVDKFGVVHHYEKDAFSHIYPRRIGTISSVRSEEVTGEDGNPFTIYYFKDSSLDFDPNDYEIDGLVKNITFQDGSDLAGRDFEVNFNSTTKEFEIITQWPYDNDIQMPNEDLLPAAGNKYVLWNITMPIEYYPLAEQEFKEAVDDFLEESRLDVSVYKAHTDYIDIDERELNLTIGQRIRLENDEYFEDGYRNSRITKITRKVVRPTEIDAEISDVLSKSGLEKINDNVTEVKEYTKVATGGMPQMIRSWEETKPTDTNMYSARKAQKEFLSKYQPGTAYELLRFLKGIEIGEAIDSMLAGKGIVADENGRLQLSRLEVRDSMTVNEIIYNRQSAMEGDFIFSEAGTIESIEEVESGTFEVAIRKDYDFDFTALEEGDIVRGVVNNLQSQTKEYYTSWCRVIEKDTSANALTLVQYDDDEVPGGKNYPPTKLMKLNRWGNTTNQQRQRVWFISSYDGQIVWLTGVNKPILEIWNYASTWGLPPNFLTSDGNLPLNPDQPYFYARGAVIQDLIRVDYQGKPLMELVDRGVWSEETAADEDAPYLFEEYNETTLRYESHEVWHNSIKWRCLSSRTTEEPRWNSSDWEALSGNYEMSIEPTGGQRFFRGSNVYTTLTATLYNGDADISADVEDSQVEWTRVSSKSDEDLAWNILRAGAGLELEITPLDLPSDWLETRQVSYKCTVAVRETTVVSTFNINK